MNTPSIPVSRKRNSIMYGLTRSVMLNEARMASGVRSVVSRTMVSESPSTPRWRDEPIASYQTYDFSNWKPDWVVSKLNHAYSESASGMRLATSANQRNSLFSPFGRNKRTSAASVGTNRMSKRRWSIAYSLSQHEEIEHSTDGNEHNERQHQILLDASGLDEAQLAANPLGDSCRAIADEAIDDRQVEIISNGGTDPTRGWTEDVQEAVDHALVQELVDDVLREPVRRFDQDTVVDLVDVIFVLEQRELQPVLRRGVDVAIDEPAQEQTSQSNSKRSQQRNGIECNCFRMFSERPSHKLMEPVGDESAKGREMFRDA